MKILFVDPCETTLLNFRKEVVLFLISEGHKITIASELTDRIRHSFPSSVTYRNINCDLKSKKIFYNFKLFRKYRKIIRIENPDLILSYTIKPNLYCALAKTKSITQFSNITGLGHAFDKSGPFQRMIVWLYRIAFKKTEVAFFQNSEDLHLLADKRVFAKRNILIPGSGVNTTEYSFCLPNNRPYKTFLFASRFIKEKGIGLLIESIKQIQQKYPTNHYVFIGDEAEYGAELDDLAEKGVHLSRIGKVPTIKEYIQNSDFLVSPSYYHEGLSNVLLESLSSGRPIITTSDNPGCKEVLREGLTGFGCKKEDVSSLVSALIKASECSSDQYEKMSKYSSEFCIERFDRNIVILAYQKEINRSFGSEGK
jgi:glycosyltransferase involved in cell wall biosynthesis